MRNEKNNKTNRKGKSMTKNGNYLSIMKGVMEAPIDILWSGDYWPEKYYMSTSTMIMRMIYRVDARMGMKTVGEAIQLKLENLPKGFGKGTFECLQMTIDNFVSHRFNN